MGTPERQRATAEAIVAAWEHAPWPQGLLSYNLFVGTDGGTVLHYSQWTSDEAQHEFVRTLRQSRIDEIDDAVPGIVRHGVVNYRLYRSFGPDPEAAPRVPGCIVVVNVEFDGPDAERQRRWVDAVFEALEAQTDLPSGGLAGHFHVSTDGTRVLNYAEWTDEDSHRKALEGSGPKWRRVQTFPGMISNKYKRYRLHRSLVPPQQSNQV